MAGALTHVNPVAHVVPKRNHSRSSLLYRPRMITMSLKKSYWVSIHEDIEAHLKQAIPVKEPLQVFESMRHLVFSAPKNMAPALCIAACELVGGSRDQALAAASALHVMYAASFTHERMPLSDRPSLMPDSRPVVHHVFNPNMELLMADGILPFGLELLADSDDPTQNKSDRVLRVMIEMTRALGSQGIVDGQYREILHNQSDDRGSNSTDTIDYISQKKEGELYACGAASGAILGEGNEEEIEKLRKYGFYVGMIQGVSERMATKESLKKEELKNLALQELRGFDEEKIEAISSFVEVNSSHVNGL